MPHFSFNLIPSLVPDISSLRHIYAPLTVSSEDGLRVFKADPGRDITLRSPATNEYRDRGRAA